MPNKKVSQLPVILNSAVAVDDLFNLIDISAGDLGSKKIEVQELDKRWIKNPMTTAGDIVYGQADGVPARLPKSLTDGFRLTSRSGGPAWENPALTWEEVISNTTQTVTSVFNTYVPTSLTKTVVLPTAQSILFKVLINTFTTSTIIAPIFGYTIDGGAVQRFGQQNIATATIARNFTNISWATDLLPAGSHTILIVACQALGTSYVIEPDNGGIGIAQRMKVGYLA